MTQKKSVTNYFETDCSFLDWIKKFTLSSFFTSDVND